MECITQLLFSEGMPGELTLDRPDYI
ncbi:hypothetical protein DENIT_11812 [Pseudomonas veronii]|nr:hypothetical protein DENIT_11812 [Pseudomonas veronii]